MGNWCTLTTWFACTNPGDARAVVGGLRSGAARHRWFDPDRWALRAGLLSPTLVQAESLEKYGASTFLAELALRHVHDARVVQLCPGEGIAVGPTDGPGLALAWNYVVSPAPHDLAGVASCLGGGAVALDAGRQRVLCLPEHAPLSLTGGRYADVVMRDDPLGRLAYAFGVADPYSPGRTSRHLLGLYTPLHGWVHMLAMTMFLQDRSWEHRGHVHMEAGAGHNPVHYEFSAGPFARSIYVENVPPIAMTGLRWPL